MIFTVHPGVGALKLGWKMAADARRLVKPIQRMEKQSTVLLANPNL
jgi:hypothetical protein